MGPTHSTKLVETFRGNVTENIHYGHYVVCDHKGIIHDSAGNIELETYPRSSLKLIQAIDLVESGAAQQFQLNSKHLALTCSSHRGEAFHIKVLTEWLERIQCTSNHLTCGAALPLDGKAMHQILADGEKEQTIYHMCSGKHTGMLTVCRHHQYNMNYDSFDHPIQQAYRQNLSLLTEKEADNFNWGIDGCTLPTPALPLHSMAKAVARLANPINIDQSKCNAITTILDALAESPQYLCGSSQLPTMLAQVTKGRVISKNGADGFYIALLRDRGIGIALKITDGSALASNVLILAILNKIGALQSHEAKQLQHLLEPTVHDSRGRCVGHVHACINTCIQDGIDNEK